MSEPEIQSRLDFIDLDSSQRQTLAAMQPMLQDKIESALDRFYAKARQTPSIKSMFRDDAHMAKAKGMQKTHWMRIASGSFDSEFHSSVRRIGGVHARIGLEPRWYIGAYAIVIESLLQEIAKRATPWQRLTGAFRGPSDVAASVAIVKAALVDIELSVSIYLEVAQAERDAAAKVTQEREQQLNELLAWIGTSAENIRLNSMEIAKAAEDLARRTESNAASIEQTSAALTAMEARLKSTASAAKTTVARADDATATVSSGRTTAELAVATMGQVSRSAEGIDSVIEGVDKIAFQTRVLAMNAAIEAGRAGEAGRGFAVVADLVNALAMRAEEEAKRARDLLTVTQAEIATAVDAVQKVDTSLSEIATNVDVVNELLAGMADDNTAQSTAIVEISGAVSSIDKATQQNAAMVEETSAAARNLTAEVTALSERAGMRDRSAGSDVGLSSVAGHTSRTGRPALSLVAKTSMHG